MEFNYKGNKTDLPDLDSNIISLLRRVETLNFILNNMPTTFLIPPDNSNLGHTGSWWLCRFENKTYFWSSLNTWEDAGNYFSYPYFVYSLEDIKTAQFQREVLKRKYD